MAQYKLHCFCQSGNSFKVALYLNCAGLDWEPVFTDFMHGATRDPKWREAVNAMGEAPVPEVDGKKLTQSGVILTYLADKTGKFKPATEDERLEALRWILFDNHKFTGTFATYRFMKAFLPNAPDPNVLAFLKGRFDSTLGIVERHLGRSSFVAGDKPTIADFSLAGYMFYPPEESGYDWAKSTPNLHAWIERMRALPGWKDPYDLMPGERIKPLR
ncbi:MAG: glutathione S-transferase C-terminal domain-containing protein [Hyphomonadaceae bacterium]|nr:glutathione S-transferase C-terminal domain-containing protein [Hyphomonadaceae bacterium]